MNLDFSAQTRATHLSNLHQETFDLLIVGGGITGAGIALDAAQRGLKVLLVEKKDFAWGTSSRSTKLIHGGLRYLKQMEFGLVREVGRERAIVYHNARHLVRPEKMLLPIVENGSLGKTLSSIGLWIYDYLAGVEAGERRVMLNSEQTLKSEPLLRKDGLKAGGLYYEYRSDDARLSIEIIKSAVLRGAICLNYVEVSDFTYDAQGQIKGLVLEDKIKGQTYQAQGRCVVNAAGPWVDTLRAKEREGVHGKRLHLSKGVHLVLPFFKLPLKQSVYFDVASDPGRMCFAIPRQGITYVGTTDTNYTQSIESPLAEQADIDYILAACNAMFPSAHLKEEDVLSTWAGLRPLIHQDGRSPSELSRKDEIFETKSGLFSIAGGKLTGYRKMAERVVDRVCQKLQVEAVCETENLVLHGGDFQDEADLQRFVALQSGEARQVEISASDISKLCMRYGRDTEWIVGRAYELYHEEPNARKRLELAELDYALQFESVLTPSDYLVRRSGRLYFERPELAKIKDWIFEAMQAHFAWTEAESQAAKADFEAEYASVMQWRPSASPWA